MLGKEAGGGVSGVSEALRGVSWGGDGGAVCERKRKNSVVDGGMRRPFGEAHVSVPVRLRERPSVRKEGKKGVYDPITSGEEKDSSNEGRKKPARGLRIRVVGGGSKTGTSHRKKKEF